MALITPNCASSPESNNNHAIEPDKPIDARAMNRTRKKPRTDDKAGLAMAISASPDRRERQMGTLVCALGAGAAPTVMTGQTVTRLTPCSAANLLAAFSKRTLDTGYACDTDSACVSVFQSMERCRTEPELERMRVRMCSCVPRDQTWWR